MHIIYYVVDALFFYAAGFATRWYITRHKIFSRAGLQQLIQWAESLPTKSEVTIRREAELMKRELSSRL